MTTPPLHPPLPPLVIASHNIGKIREISELLSPYTPHITPVASFSSVVPEETGDTFAENALIKARHAFQVSHSAALSDDSGLVIDTLGGSPGIHSARLADEKGGFHPAMNHILSLLATHPQPQDRKAHFVCVLALVIPSPSPSQPPQEFTFEGTVEGHIASSIDTHKAGFGYDPFFIPHNHSHTFSALGKTIKNTISHRKHAFDKLIKHLENSSPSS